MRNWMEVVDCRPPGRALARFFVEEVLQPPPGTCVTGFKEIRLSSPRAWLERVLDFMKRFFPGAKFVFNTRGHGEVIRSGGWADQPEAEMRHRRKLCDSRFES